MCDVLVRILRYDVNKGRVSMGSLMVCVECEKDASVSAACIPGLFIVAKDCSVKVLTEASSHSRFRDGQNIER